MMRTPIFWPGRIMLAGLCILILTKAGSAQPVSGQQTDDSLILDHSPARATLLSAVIPGAGQFYNKKYWKIPVIYGAFAGLGYLVKFNNDRFKTYKDAYILRVDGDPVTVDDFTDRFSDSDLKALRDFYRRNRDLSLIFAGLVYVLNIVDASVDAHLFYFDVSDDLSMRVDPVFAPMSPHAPVTALQLTLLF